MRVLSFLSFAILTITGCGTLDRMCDGDGDDLPPRPGLRDRFEREPDPRDSAGDRPPLHWFGPSRTTPINPPIPDLPPQREPVAPRAEDPSWRNR